MISFVNRTNLQVSKYDECVENALQSRIYGFSWYLDTVCEYWGVMVLDDYEAVMPVAWNKKYGIKYVYPPLWVLELGVFSNKLTEIEPFVHALMEEFRFAELRLNTNNMLPNPMKETLIKRMQWISLEKTYNDIFSNYRKDRKKDLKKANTFELKEVWNDDPEKVITLFKNNIGKRDASIKEQDYANLGSLIEVCLKKRVGEVLSIYDADNSLVATAFFLIYKEVVTILISSTDLKNRKNGANTFLIDSAIKRYQGKYTVFNFGGSSIETIAGYFKSFGASDAEYHFIKYNKLPRLIRLFKS